jgi:hypothetical protein
MFTNAYKQIDQHQTSVAGCMLSGHQHRLHVTLVLRLGYVPEKRRVNRNRANRIQNAHLKQCISWGLGD